jgi:hypothetical protein
MKLAGFSFAFAKIEIRDIFTGFFPILFGIDAEEIRIQLISGNLSINLAESRIYNDIG